MYHILFLFIHESIFLLEYLNDMTLILFPRQVAQNQYFFLIQIYSNQRIYEILNHLIIIFSLIYED